MQEADVMFMVGGMTCSAIYRASHISLQREIQGLTLIFKNQDGVITSSSISGTKGTKGLRAASFFDAPYATVRDIEYVEGGPIPRPKGLGRA